jgi:hypothetical protein
MITMSEEIGHLSAALVKAQSEVDNAVKNATNPHFRSSYANLEAVLFTVKPILAKHDLSVVQFPGYGDGVCTLSTLVLHKTGEWLQSEAGAPLDKPTAWSVGSCVTYLRRYSLASICQIAQEDDDGSAASEPSNPKPTKKVAKQTEAIWAKMDTAIKEKKATKKPTAAETKKEAQAEADHLAERLGVLEAITAACEQHGDVDIKIINAAQAILADWGPLDRTEKAIKHLELEVARA